MAGRLEGKIAVITGAGSGMGAAMVERFCREGARVIAADISGQQNDVAKPFGDACVPVQANIAESAEVQRMLQTAVDTFGRLDILCNNAGIDGALGLTGAYDEAEFDKVWSINGRGPFLGMRYGIPHMLKSGGGAIVNTVSIASMVAFPQMPAYCAAKGAVLMMTKTAAVEYATQGIRVNAICPGTVKTGLSMGMPREYIDMALQGMPMRRIGLASEIADVALFLASGESSFVTGTVVVADGGYTAI
ncbi:MAG TPA: SDR family oxidoreductase [Beijerinckia sp.]|nr:SDR family oxidoreductase [Beijerinckia sp.]